jgi:HSP20 family protein
MVMAQHDFLPSLFTRRGIDIRNPFGALQEEIDRVFEAFRGGQLAPLSKGFAFNPSIDVAATADAIDITVELPGCEAKDVEISVGDRALVLRGEKKSETQSKDKDWHVTERSYGSFARTIPLGFEPEPDKVEASFDKGVLKIHVPRPAGARDERKTIPIKSG